MAAELQSPGVGRPQRVFKPSFWVCFLTVAVPVQLVVALLAAAVGVVHGPGVGGPLFAVLAVAGLLGSVLNTAVTRRALAPVVGPRGIEASGRRGRRGFAPWGSIHTVGLHVFSGTAQLKVTADTLPGPLWVPLYLADLDGFADAVREHAGGDHPLARALDEWLALGPGE